jgi:transcriptional regulator with XRE-family HTH domain
MREKLIKLRMVMGLSRMGLAQASKLSATVVQRVEEGKMVNPGSIPKLARGYGITPKELVDIIYDDGEKITNE